jgi:propane monooxygenase small subunit
MLADDEQHGSANKEIMQGWLEEWVPVSLAAAQHLQPIWSEVSEKSVRFEDSLDASKARLTELLEAINLETPKEVSS